MYSYEQNIPTKINNILTLEKNMDRETLGTQIPPFFETDPLLSIFILHVHIYSDIINMKFSFSYLLNPYLYYLHVDYF